VRSEAEAECREYVSMRLEHLRRVAYLLCHDWHTADDLVSTVLLKLFTSWRKARRADNIDAYVRGMLTNAWLDELRRPWRRERTAAAVPEHAVAGLELSDRRRIGELLEALGPRQRAVVVLRFYCDMSIEQTAQLLGISEGTVKSQAARGLKTLRQVVVAKGEW
jgi:RNA polymerase sigma-70 factor (sigma-E family)